MKTKRKKNLGREKLKRIEKAEEEDKKLRNKSIVDTRKAKRMISIEQYAKDNKVTIAQAMIHFMGDAECN